MDIYRIVQHKSRTRDLSGTGAAKFGGRWNSKGVFMLYTSENSSLALLETLVHVDPSLLPSGLFILQLRISDKSPVYTLPDKLYPANWQTPGNLHTQLLGDQFIREKKYLAMKVRSAVNDQEYNYLLNPEFAGYLRQVKIVTVTRIQVPASRFKLFNT